MTSLDSLLARLNLSTDDIAATRKAVHEGDGHIAAVFRALDWASEYETCALVAAILADEPERAVSR